MRSAIRHVVSVLILASVAVAATGCSHNTVDSASQALRVTYTPSPAGAGRYERASFFINIIEVLPADPRTAALYGSARLRFQTSPFTAKLTETQDVEFAKIALGAGTYRVTLLEITAPTLVDENVIPIPGNCMSGIEVIDGTTNPPGQVPSTFAFTDPQSLTFTIRPGQTKLAITVNVPGLIAGYESSYTCQNSCGPGGFPCLTAFDVANFRAILLANLTLE